MRNVMEMKQRKRANGPACVLAIGRATPPNVIYQKDFPDFYFNVTNTNHKVELKEKFRRICDKTKIRKRHSYLTKEILEANPNMLTYGAPSLDARRALTVDYVPKLCMEAARKAIKEWDQPKSKITHLLAYSTLALSMPNLDCDLMRLLKLDPNVQRTGYSSIGCFAGPHLLRQAMEIAENNRGARVLVVFSEITTVNFHGPHEDHIDAMVGQALFGDGAAAVIVGADPNTSIEQALFELVHGQQTTVITTSAPHAEVVEMGQTIHLHRDLPSFVSKNVAGCLMKALRPLGISEWNELFWIAHNGGPKILDEIEGELGLGVEKLDVSRHILSEYGNIGCVGVVFMLDEMRKRSLEQGKSTTGLGFDWGVMFGFGPGFTVETLVLRSVHLEA